MSRRIRSAAGFTLLPVILAMTLIAAIAFLLNRDNGMNAAMVSREIDGDRARFAAEAGLQAANARVQSLGCTGGFPVSGTPVTNGDLGGASYSAYATTGSGNTTGLVSTGNYNGASVTLTRTPVIVYQSVPKTFTLQPNGTLGMDTYIIRPSTQNRDGGATLSTDANNNYPLVKFDLSMFPTGSVPLSATLSLYGSGGLGIGIVNLYRLTTDWQENVVNWPTRMAATPWTTPGGDYHPVKVTSTSAVTGQWNDFNVTDLASAWMSGRYPNNGVILDMALGLGSINFTSSDSSDALHWPKISVTYLLPCGMTGPEDLPSGTVTLAPTADSFNDNSALQADNNNGGATSLKVYYTPAREDRTLMQFDTSSIPPGATIQSAKLRLYVSSVGSATTNTKNIWANAINESWVEGTGNNTNKICPSIPVAGASWNHRTNCTNWSFVSPPYSAQAWATMTKMPTARTNHVVATVNNKIYTIGGYNPVGGYFNTVEEYDPSTNAWTTKAPMPTKRSDAAAAVVNGKIYVFGGTAGGTLDKTEVYDPATNTWATKKVMSAGRKFMAAAAVNNKIYVIGGATNTTAVNTNAEYDPATDTWASKASMTTARMYLLTQSVNGKVHAIGGWSGLSSLTSHEVYDPGTNTWTNKAALPTGTDSMGSAVLGNKIYLIGGMRGNAATNAVVVYDALNNAYTNQLNYPVATDVPAAAVVNGYVYSLGGDDGVSTVYQNHYKFDTGAPTPVATASDETTSASPLAAGFNGGWITFDLKALVQEWVDGIRPNNGIVIYSEGADQFNIHSRENSTKNPQLIVTY